VIHSVVGQNERWAQLTALQPSPAAQSGQGGGPAFSNAGTTTADPTVVNPVAGSTSSPLSSNMSFMLMMFGGGLDSATGSGGGGRDRFDQRERFAHRVTRCHTRHTGRSRRRIDSSESAITDSQPDGRYFRDYSLK
jgi:hypothetical protein